MRHPTKPATRPDDLDTIPYRLGTPDRRVVWVHYGVCKEAKIIGYTLADGKVISAMLSYHHERDDDDDTYLPAEYLA